VGADRLNGGGGKNRYSAGRGADRINAMNNKRDRVNCGGGVDTAFVDAADRIAGCETFVVRP